MDAPHFSTFFLGLHPVSVVIAFTRGYPNAPRGFVCFDGMESRRLRVLVIEDDECTRDALVDYLNDEGFAVESALDGQEALGVAAAGGIDIIVLDLGLPVLDGMAFADIWRSHPGRARVPIVATSGLPQGEALAAGFGPSHSAASRSTVGPSPTCCRPRFGAR